MGSDLNNLEQAEYNQSEKEINEKVNSVDNFLKAVFDKIKDYDDPIWFRGESRIFEHTLLVPNAYREWVNKINKEINLGDYYPNVESNLKAEFERRALQYILSENIENSSWNRYFLMQHYKICTRLLDWTEDAIKALYFAIKENDDEDARIWILRPFILNKITMGKIYSNNLIEAPNTMVIPPLSKDHIKSKPLFDDNKKMRYSELTRIYLNYQFSNREKYYPLAIDPPFLNKRMTAQKACFTIFGNVPDGLYDLHNEDNNSGMLYSIIIDGSAKKLMLKQLEIMGIDENSIYPDLDGLGVSIMNKYKSKISDACL